MDDGKIPQWQLIATFIVVLIFFIWFFTHVKPEEPKYVYIPGHWEKEPISMHD